MSQTNQAKNESPITVYIAKRTITSGRGGYPSIGYRAQLVSAATLDVIAETKTVDGVNDAAWRAAGEALAKRRGYKVVDGREAQRIRAEINLAAERRDRIANFPKLAKPAEAEVLCDACGETIDDCRQGRGCERYGNEKHPAVPAKFITRPCLGHCGNLIRYQLDDYPHGSPHYSPTMSAGIAYSAGHLCCACTQAVAAFLDARNPEGK